MSRAGKQGKQETHAEKRLRRQLNSKAHQQAFYIWLGFIGILACVLAVVYFIATRPKAALLNQLSAVQAAAAAAAKAAAAPDKPAA